MQFSQIRRYYPKFIFLAFFLLLCLPISNAQEAVIDTIHVTTRHPEFGSGQYSIGLAIEYGSVSGNKAINIKDAAGFKMNLKWRANNQLIPQGGFEFRSKDSILISFSSGVTFYWSDPTRYNSVVNPDGEPGKPSLTLISTARFGENSGSEILWAINGKVLLPMNRHFSALFGMTYRQHHEISDHDDIIAGFKVYSSSYSDWNLYENRDGVVGSVAFEVLAGKSSEGKFISLETLFPMSKSMTLTVLTQFDQDKISSRKTLTAGLGFAFFLQ